MINTSIKCESGRILVEGLLLNEECHIQIHRDSKQIDIRADSPKAIAYIMTSFDDRVLTTVLHLVNEEEARKAFIKELINE